MSFFQPPQARFYSPELLAMEELYTMNNGGGQSQGYILYRKQFDLRDGVNITIRGHVRDLLYLIVNGQIINDPILHDIDLNKFGSWAPRDSSMVVDLTGVPNTPCNPTCTVDFLVENTGRMNFGTLHQFDQKKGLWEGDVLIDGVKIQGGDWEIISLEFHGSWVTQLQGWQPYDRNSNLELAPRMLRGTLNVLDPVPKDTYFDFDCAQDCRDWLKGVVFVNGFNIGRYWTVGPQKALYIPGPLLQFGNNEVSLKGP